MLHIGCPFPYPTPGHHCFHKPTAAKFSQFKEGEKDVLTKYRKDAVDGPIIVFTRKTIVFGTCIQKSTNICKLFIGLDACQLNHLSTSKHVLTGSCPHRVPDSEMRRFTPREKQSPVALKIWSCQIFIEHNQMKKLKTSIHLEDRRKMIASSGLMNFVIFTTLIRSYGLLLSVSTLKTWVYF